MPVFVRSEEICERGNVLSGSEYAPCLSDLPGAWGRAGAVGTHGGAMDAICVVENEVRELVRRRGLDPASDPAAVRGLVEDVVAAYDERSLAGSLPTLNDLALTARQVFDTVAGLGPLQRFLDDPTVEEVWINNPGKVFVARAGRSELTTTILTAEAVRDLVERMLKSSGRRVDLSTPFVDATLPDGSRLHVVIPEVTREHWAVNIRKFVLPVPHLDALVALGTLSAQAAAFLEAAVSTGLNILVSGGTQAGKTTMLSCLAAAIPARERVITAEEVFELNLCRTSGCRRDADPPAQPRGHGRDPVASPGEGGAADAPVSAHRRRGAAGGEPRPAHRAEQRRSRHVHDPRQRCA